MARVLPFGSPVPVKTEIAFPDLASFGMALGFVLGGSLLTEIVFSYPGQGYLLVQAVRNQDYPLMQGIFLVVTLAVLFGATGLSSDIGPLGRP